MTMIFIVGDRAMRPHRLSIFASRPLLVLVVVSILTTLGASNDFGFTSCCALSEEELSKAFKTATDCPKQVSGVATLNAGVSGVSKCEKCASGRFYACTADIFE